MTESGVWAIRRDLIMALYDKKFITDKSGVKTVEVVGASFVADEEMIVGEPNHEWHARELAWYCSMSRNVNDIPPPVPEIWRQVADADGVVNSNYGWCIWSKENYSQYGNVYVELKNNPESRRAVMIYTRPSMWDEYNYNGRSDFCCTNAVQYMIRDGKLDAVVQMRSNDAVFGYKGDRFWQAHVQAKLAEQLYVPVGKLIWQVGSLHVYERHFYLLHHYAATGERSIKKKDYAELYPDSEWR